MPDTTRLTTALADRYQILREVGAGGMATVYLAEDVKHHRQVALKVLRPELAAVIGAERFLKEIETTANLQHPHILPLFDSGTVDGTVFYVMPYVEGESLRDRLTREKQLGTEEAVRITREVASALDYAHRKGIVHRDIKPENILLHDGQALVADFGIALAASNTGSTRMTETGMSLGTPHYMSPEQAMGERTLDARTDVYALGCVLYEMLSGEPPFNGPTAQAIVARVMTDKPRPLTEARPTVPGHVEAAVATALQKLPADRFATAAEFSAALASTGYTTPGRPVAAPARTSGARLPWIAAGAATVIAMAAAVVALNRKAPVEAPVIRAVLQVPADAEIARPLVTLSPDGTRLVVAVTQRGTARLMQRRLSDLEFTPVAGTDEGEFHFLSHDGRHVVFRQRGNAVRVPLDGGPPVTIGPGVWPGHWLADGTILFPASYNTGLFRMTSEGAERAELSRPDSTRGELGHWWPQLLPGGEQVLFTAYATPLANARIEALTLATGERTVLVEGAVFARYLPIGHLLFSRGGVVFAQRMELNPARISGPVVPVLDDVASQTTEGLSGWSVSDNGILAYVRASRHALDTRLVWLDRTGAQVGVVTVEGRLSGPSLAPDSRRLAYVRHQEYNEVWVADLGRGTRTRVSEADRNNFGPSWTPDGSTLLHVSEAPVFDLYRRAPDAGSVAEPVVLSGEDKTNHTLTPDGRDLVFEQNSATVRALWHKRMGSEEPAVMLLSGNGNLRYPALSPDGRWLAYSSDESGASEVYLVPYPSVTGRRQQVSTSGGREPRWTRGGRELVYLNGDAMMATAFDPATGTLAASTRLFAGRFLGTFQETASYDVTPDGARFIMVTREPGTEPREIVVVTNWFKELREKMAGGR